MQPLTVLSVAFPLAPVGSDTAGGSEQVLAMLDRGLVRAGHRSIVVACEGSRCDGELIATPRPDGVLDSAAKERARSHHRAAVAAALSRSGPAVDIVHMHGLDFDAYLPPPGPPVLATLHLPPDWHAPGVFALPRPRTYLSCVSRSQHERCPPAPNLLGVIGNGVDLEILQVPQRPPRSGRPPFVFSLGRICPEKGFHRALRAARKARMPMILAGHVFSYPEHTAYYHTHIVPLLDSERRFIGSVGMEEKRALMAEACAVLIPSEVAETSSLVAMEALACGTPVITFGAGALRDIIEGGESGEGGEDGRIGYLVADEDEMAAAIRRAGDIDPAACRRAAEKRFSSARMVTQYIELYRRLLAAP